MGIVLSDLRYMIPLRIPARHPGAKTQGLDWPRDRRGLMLSESPEPPSFLLPHQD